MKSKSTGRIWHMSVHERNGLLFFFLLSVILILVIKNVGSKNTPVFIHSVENLTNDNKNENSKKNMYAGKKGNSQYKNKKTTSLNTKRHHFSFNPNTVSADSFRLLGFSKFTSENLLKYRRKGGVITTLKQLKSMYGIDTALVNSLAEEIYFYSDRNELKKEAYQDKSSGIDPAENSLPRTKSDTKPFSVVELNEADSAALLAIRGIGPHYAGKIIKMKKKMGGFANVRQLLECRILPDSVFYKIEQYFAADPSKMEKIDINRADFKTLIQHPYMKENLVKIILHYRDNHGTFNSMEQLKNIKILDRETYEKLVPHFKIISN